MEREVERLKRGGGGRGGRGGGRRGGRGGGRGEEVRTGDAPVLDAGAHGGGVRPARARRGDARAGDRLLHDGGRGGDLRVGAELEQDVAVLVEDGVRERVGGRAGEDARVGALERLEQPDDLRQVNRLRHVGTQERLRVVVERLHDLPLDDRLLVARHGWRADADLEAVVAGANLDGGLPVGTRLGAGRW